MAIQPFSGTSMAGMQLVAPAATAASMVAWMSAVCRYTVHASGAFHAGSLAIMPPT